MQERELVEMHLRGEWQRKQCKWWCFEGKQDDEGEERKSDDAGTTAGCPPCFRNGVLGLTRGRCRGNRGTALKFAHGLEVSGDLTTSESRRRQIGFHVPELRVRRHIVGPDAAQCSSGDKQQGERDELSVGWKRVGLTMGLVAGLDCSDASVLPPRASPKRKLSPDDACDSGASGQEMGPTDDDSKEGEDEPEDVGVAVGCRAHLVDGEVGLDPLVVVDERGRGGVGIAVCIVGCGRGVGWLCSACSSRKGWAVALDDGRGLGGVHVRKRH